MQAQLRGGTKQAFYVCTTLNIPVYRHPLIVLTFRITVKSDDSTVIRSVIVKCDRFTYKRKMQRSGQSIQR